MKILIYILILIFIAGCSAKSYTRTIAYPDRNITNQYQTIQILKSNSCDGMYYSNDCPPYPAGMYLQDDLGW
jgi:hypothetical protein